jgi:Zn-dependent protease
LTLNPLAHIDPLGFLGLILVGFGWGKPVPYNPIYLRDRRWGPVLIAIAGPMTNLMLALLFALIARFVLPQFGEGNLLVYWLVLSVQMNLTLMLFNLIPVPPLDGSKFLLACLHERSVEKVRFFLETRGPLILLSLVIMDRVLPIHLFGWLGSAVRFGTNMLLGL